MKLPLAVGSWIRLVGLASGLAVSPLLEAAPISMFDGKTLVGWEGDTRDVWRVEDGEIVAGKLDAKQPRNDFLCTTREYGNFEMRFLYKRLGNNGGVQFRSQRIPNNHEMIGFQADFAPGIDGFLYDESRRARFLGIFDIEKGPVIPPKEGTGAAIKRAALTAVETAQRLQLREWNSYRIRAEGARIRLWINDVPTVDYTEEEEGIPKTGFIGLQIHGGATEIRYKNLTIQELPDAEEATGASESASLLRPGDVVALIGGANLERSRFNAFLQRQLFSAKAAAPRQIRNLAWEGDTVFEQWRDVNFPGIQQQLEQIGANVVLAQFGQMEALTGVAKLPEFVAAYEKLLKQILVGGRRVVLLSPTPFEPPKHPAEPDLSVRNGDVLQYVSAIHALATRLGLGFVDLFNPLMERKGGVSAADLTTNGVHLSGEGHRVVACEIARQLGLLPSALAGSEPLRLAAVEVERLWFNYWRPMNWAFLEGDRTSVPFSRDWKDGEKRLFPDEMKEFVGILGEADANVQRALAGEPTQSIQPRSAIASEPPTVPPESPEDELATLNVHPDYQVNLFASEADGVAKVVQIRWDERGRLWALCIPDYPQTKPGAAPTGRLVICEDTNRDGRADKFTVFADGLDMPLGFELGDGGVYVAASSELWHLRDTTGSGRANEKQVVLGGFGTGDTHQTINSLSWGFGGELWFSQGHSIYSRVETGYGIERHDRAGLWRLRPRTRQVDNFFNNSSAGANNWGVLSDDFGQVFHKEGAGRGAYYSVPGLIRGDLSLSSEAMNVLKSQKAKTVGFDMVGSRHFPAELQGSVVIGGEYDNTLQIHKFGYRNGRFESEQGENIIETKNKAFRPVDVRMGPDGGIYFADWYNPIVGHYQASYRHPDRNTTHGRIWRVIRKDRTLVSSDSLAGKSVPELLGQLSSPERWVKYQAKRLLFAQETGVVVKALDEWVKVLNSERDGALLLQALSLFEAHEVVRPELLKGLLRNEDYRIRAYATRTLSSWARTGKLLDAIELLQTLVGDVHPMVRLEAVVAASYLQKPGAAVVAVRVLDLPMDEYLVHALTKSLDALRGQWEEALGRGAFRFETDAHLLFALKNCKVHNALEIIRKQVDESKGTASQEQWLTALSERGNGGDLLKVLELGGGNRNVLEALVQSVGRRSVAMPVGSELPGVVGKLLQSSDDVIRGKVVRLVGLWKMEALESVVEGLVRDVDGSVPLNQAARMSLAQIQGAKSVPLLRELLGRATSDAERLSLLEVLLVASPVEASKEALARLVSVGSVEGAVPVLKVLVARKEGVVALRSELSQKDRLPQAAARHALNALNQIGGADQGIVSGLMPLAGLSAGLPVYAKETISKAVKEAWAVGVAEEGRKVFEQSGCAACHAANGVGGKIGPDLSALSRGLPPDMIVTEVLWPALNVKEGYEAASVTLKDGRLVAGFKQNETAESVAIRDMNTGETQTIRRADTASVRLGGTVMPDGLTSPLSVKQVADLMRYLFELGK